jgi:hypothetical protein
MPKKPNIIYIFAGRPAFSKMSTGKKLSGKRICMLVFSMLMTFTACKKEQDAFDYLQLIGKWEMVSENCREYIEGELLFDETNLYDAGQTFLEFKSDGTGATYEKDSLVVSFTWTRNGATINIETDNIGLFERFTIQSVDPDMLAFRVNIEEDLDPALTEYLSFCDYVLSRAGDGS